MAPNTYKPRFINLPLRFEDNGGFPFTLTDSLGYVTNVASRGTFFVPAGFETDLASIPRVLWNVLPPIGKYDAAAVLHDFYYRNPRQLMRHGEMPTRSEADSVLNEAMGVLGVPAQQRWMIYLGVRLGGWRTWNNYRAKEQRDAV